MAAPQPSQAQSAEYGLPETQTKATNQGTARVLVPKEVADKFEAAKYDETNYITCLVFSHNSKTQYTAETMPKRMHPVQQSTLPLTRAAWKLHLSVFETQQK